MSTENAVGTIMNSEQPARYSYINFFTIILVVLFFVLILIGVLSIRLKMDASSEDIADAIKNTCVKEVLSTPKPPESGNFGSKYDGGRIWTKGDLNIVQVECAKKQSEADQLAAIKSLTKK